MPFLFWVEFSSIIQGAAEDILFKYGTEIITGGKSGIKGNVSNGAVGELQLLFCIFNFALVKKFCRCDAYLVLEFYFKSG